MRYAMSVTNLYQQRDSAESTAEISKYREAAKCGILQTYEFIRGSIKLLK